MIINYTKEQDSYIAKYIQEITGDQVFYAKDKINSLETSPIHSEKPYVLIADYDMLCKAKTLFTMGRTEFSGSKILYVIFVDSSRAYLTFAKSISAVKGMVLFGCDCMQAVQHESAVSEEKIIKSKKLGSFVRDSIPFETGVKNLYPMRCKN